MNDITKYRVLMAMAMAAVGVTSLTLSSMTAQGGFANVLNPLLEEFRGGGNSYYSMEAEDDSQEDSSDDDSSDDDSSDADSSDNKGKDNVRQSGNKRFPDVDENEEEGKAAEALRGRGVVQGFPDGEFKGAQFMNRAQAAKLILLACAQQMAEDSDTELSDMKFIDVFKGEWFEEYVNKAYRKGVIQGHSDGTFRPASAVNRAEFVKMLFKACDPKVTLTATTLKDVAGQWFSEYAPFVEQYKLFDSIAEGMMYPSRLLTRGEVVVAIYRLLGQ